MTLQKALTFSVLLACAPACGARTPLAELASGQDGAAEASSDGAAGAPAEAGPDAWKPDASIVDVSNEVTPDTGPDAPVVQHCSLKPVGAPKLIIKLADQHAEAPSVVTLHPGVTGAEEASVAIQVFASGGNSYEHSSIKIARARVGQAWPEGIVLDQEPTLVGIESHGWGELTHGPASTLGLAWHGDPGGHGRPMFRTLDADSWSVGGTNDISPDGEAVLALASTGDSAPPMGMGEYAVVWRQPEYGDSGTPTYPNVAMLDANGNVIAGPYVAAASIDYPGRSPALVWTGTRYLMAESFGDCTGVLCEPASVVVARLDPLAGGGPGGLTKTGSIVVAQTGQAPRRPALAAWGGRVWLAWFEGVQGADKVTARLARLDSDGVVQGSPVVVAKDVEPDTRMVLSAGPYGAVATWNEATSNGPALALAHYDEELNAIDELQRISTTQSGSYGWTSAAMIASPPSVLVVWYGAAEPNPGLDVTWIARWDCL
jgi:hypothetical protein